MTTKEFIEQVYLKELSMLSPTHPYIAFAIISIGIEFLGKCLNKDEPTWHKTKRDDFNDAIDELLSKYSNKNLKDKLRNGFAHSFLPKGLSLTSNNDPNKIGEHMEPHPNNPSVTVIVLDELLLDFQNACKEMIRRIDSNSFDQNNKVYRNILSVD